ncbi:MAG: T9SS type A sorting domain-containing protein [Flavobacteriales bacterium]
MNEKYHCFGIVGALGLVLIASLQPVHAQVPFPACYIQDVNWTTGTHHITVPQNIYAPGDPTRPTTITGTADAELVSGSQVRLTEGFHAGDLTGTGRFRAHIDVGLGDPNDVVIIAPDPTNHVINDVLHVNKWEKLEIGLELPQDYQDAVDRFFESYYPNQLDPIPNYTADPSNVNVLHDLNPYADDSLQLVLKLISPTGEQRIKWGFFMREAEWGNSPDPATAILVEDLDDPLSPYKIRFRFSPDVEGVWQFAVAISAPHTSTLGNEPLNEVIYSGYSFVCEPPLEDNHGSLQVNQSNKRTLIFEDGTSFFGLGVNMADKRQNDNWYGPGWWTFYQRDMETMKKSMDELSSVGGNFMRMFLLRHIFAPEWQNLGVYDQYFAPDPCGTITDHVGNCQYQCWAFDQMLDHARTNDIYVQMCVDPYPPIIAYQNLWASHAYAIHYLEPNRQAAPDNPFDMKTFFYADGDPANTSSGVFYFWKRKYKYMMARWGYSVNLAAIEPFNEMDQMFGYRNVDLSIPGIDASVCPENKVDWRQDDSLPVVIDSWLSDIIAFVKGDVDIDGPVANSPLGEDRKLFLTGVGLNAEAGPDYYKPCRNTLVDLVDVHEGLYWGDYQLRYSFDKAALYRDTYTNSITGEKRPFHQGESNYYALFDQDPDPNVDDFYETSKVFNNYDVSFHNEIWASTFFGNWATASTWHWERVFWWPNSLPQAYPNGIPLDPNNSFGNFYHTGGLGDINGLDVGLSAEMNIENKTLYHHFQPLHNLLTNVNWAGLDFFQGSYTPNYVYDDVGKLESYYLLSDDGLMAVGWVHNLNAYWENSFYYSADHHNFLGCTSPTTQQLLIPGFQPGTDFNVSFFPTRLNTNVYPTGYVDQSGTGSVLLDLSTAPLNGIDVDHLDTLHSDYAFIIALNPVPKNRNSITEPETDLHDWNFSVFPNPASTTLNLILPSDDEPKDIAMYDLSGKRIFSVNSNGASLLTIPTEGIAKGAYCIRVSDPSATRMKTLVIH